MSDAASPADDAAGSRRLEPESGPVRPSAPEVLPPAVDPTDPVAPQTHLDGGTYAPGDYSPAARRSEARTDQFERPPGGADADAAQHSGLAGARGLEGPASVAGGH